MKVNVKDDSSEYQATETGDVSDDLEKTVAKVLTERGMTIAAAESCTGGLISKRLTDVPGASKFFAGGIVAYSPSAKTATLDVDPALIKEKGAVSREVALAMADGARIKLGSDIGVGVTGIAGPESDESGLRPGTVFVALTTKDDSVCRNLHPIDLGLSGPGQVRPGRDRIRISSASHALALILEYLSQLERT